MIEDLRSRSRGILAQREKSGQSAGARRSLSVELLRQVGGTVKAVAVQGSNGYVGAGPRMVVLDVSDPSSPLLVG